MNMNHDDKDRMELQDLESILSGEDFARLIAVFRQLRKWKFELQGKDALVDILEPDCSTHDVASSVTKVPNE